MSSSGLRLPLKARNERPRDSAAVRRAVKTAPPETLAQAATWGRTKARYLRLALCEGCAAQAAWGHAQHAGWEGLNPPCPHCEPIVSSFPYGTPNPDWRKTLRQREKGATRVARSPNTPESSLPLQIRVWAPVTIGGGHR
jgi:hypothetical protein